MTNAQTAHRPDPALLLWRHAEALARTDPAGAEAAYGRLLQDMRFAQAARLRLSLLAQQRGAYRAAVDHGVEAARIPTSDPELLAMLCKRLFTLGELQAAIACAAHPAVEASGSAAVAAEMGKLMTDAFEPVIALRLLRRARTGGLDSPALSYLIGLASMYCGDLDAAAREFERCLAVAPGYARALWARSKLRRWSPADHHVDGLRRAIAAVAPGHPDLPLLQYALFKELDDLGETGEAWGALQAGMQARRAHVAYDRDSEHALFRHLFRLRLPERPARTAGGPAPIFIVGMPRSGTTLLERVLSAHPDVADAGELHDFVLQLRWMCDLGGPPYLDATLAERATGLDWQALGRRYLDHTGFRASGRRFYTDKMPANFLNVGYILQALPEARILHMVRDPMDTCFSNLKELFAGAYPHSYEQLEMAGHFLAYRRLMDHWHALAPGRILDVRYEDLVTRPEAVAAEVLAHCGLQAAGSLTRIETHGGVVATASSVQVREGIHTRNVDQWRRYARHLAPMRACLEAAGRSPA